MKPDIKLAVCYYLPENQYLKNDICIPIQLGPAETGVDLGIQKDNEGDNRTDKHFFYSEYSGIYWLWKNTNAEYKGMFHHRRFLTEEHVPVRNAMKNFYRMIKYAALNTIFYKPFYYQRVITCNSDSEYFEKIDKFIHKLPDMLVKGNYDIVVPKRFLYYHTNVVEAFDEVVNRIILQSLNKVFKSEFPSYFDYFQKTLNGRKLFYSNMHVMKNSYFEEYCKLVFGVFDHLENLLISEGYYQNLTEEKIMLRIFGYIGELIMNTYILSAIDKGAKVKELPLLFNASAKGNENINYRSMKYESK